MKPRASVSRPVVALCDWMDYNYAECTPGSALYRHRAPAWVGRDEPPTPCRASVGERILTVWLPAGAVIRCRVQRTAPRGHVLDPMRQGFAHVYGSHERMTRTRIAIRLTHYPTTATGEPQA